MDYDYARGEINYGVDRLSIGAVLPLAPAADYEGKFGQTSPEFQQDVLTGDKFQHQLGQGFYDNSQDGNLDSFTISVTNSLSNLSISVQTPSSKRTLDHQPNQSLVTITNTDTPQIHGNYRADSDTFGRSQVPVTHQLHNTYKTPQPAQAPLSLFAELSAAAGGDNPFGGPLHQNSFAPTLSPSLSVSIEAGNHKLSIINNSSTPIDITATAHSQSPAHNQIPPQIAKNAAKKKSPNSLPRQPSKSPSQPIQPKRTSAFTSSSSNGKYIDTSKRLSTATSSTFINSPNGSGQMVSSPSAITSTSPSSPNTVINVSHSRTSSSHGKSSSNPRISSSSTADRSSKRVSGNATSTVSKRSSGPSQSTSPTGHKSTSTSPVGQPRPKSSKANKLPLTPEACLFGYKDLLTSYEHREIFDFPEVYYLGAPGVNKVGTPNRRVGGIEKTPPGKEPEVFNYGYDDSRGDYYLTPRDHIGYRYEIVSLLGKGSFGQVVKCFDHKEKRHVALKIIRNKKRFEKQGTVEVKVLDKMRTVDFENKYHSVHMLDHFYFRGHLCITFEMLGINLYEWLKAGGFRGVHLGVIRTFAIQILKCLEIMQEHKIIHCDLKPENVLLCDMLAHQPSYRDSNHPTTYQRMDYGKSSPTPNYYGPPGFDATSSQYDIKVIDFGSSCFESEKIYTYVQSRFYRSPEVILGMSYTIAIDMWSFGAILAELFTGYPIFPGENEQEQLACIMEIRGVPELELLEKGSRMKLFFDVNGNPRIVANSKGKKRRPGAKSLASVLRCSDPSFLNFLECCFTWDPEKRITPREALLHDWITGVNDPPPPPIRSAISSRTSLNASPVAASSRGSRLSAASSTTSSASKKGSEPQPKNSSLGRSKLGTTSTKATTGTSSHQKALSGSNTEHRTLTKENDGTSKPRSNSLGNTKSKSSAVSYMGAALNQASQFTAGVVKSIKAGRISTGARSAKTPNDSSNGSSNTNSPAISQPNESSESIQKSVKKAISQPSSPNARVPVSQVSPSHPQQQTYSQNHNYSPSSISSSPLAPNLNTKQRNTLFTTNVPITIKGGGIINIHNPDGTTTTYMPGQQLPVVNIQPAGYSSSASKRTSTYGTPVSSTSRSSVVYNSSSGQPESPSEAALHPELKPLNSSVRDSPKNGPSPKLSSTAKRLSQGFLHFGDLGGKDARRKSTDKSGDKSDTASRRSKQNAGKRVSGWFS